MTEFFNLSKLFWALASPDHVLVWLLLLAWWLMARGFGVWGRRLVAGVGMSLVALMWLPLGDWVLAPLEQRFPLPEPLDGPVEGIVVLGGAEAAELSARWGQPQFNGAAERMMVVPGLLQRYPAAQVVFSGGSGSVLRPDAVGADAARQWFDAVGVGQQVRYESRSRNTHENALYTIALLGGVPQGRWLLVTSGFHMPRSVGIFRKLGWDISPYPVDFYTHTTWGNRLDPELARHLWELQTGMREWTGLLVYWATGRTSELLPSPH